ncbi:MAG: 16S rRNA (cytidine(1402)-2'-O)-methyltransferase [Caldiserica bacterium]|nr:MAG: 16S rRNA (cytidine(1402)-2'-O)-methyltransferase [Caldisericota bacterium]
MRNKGVLFIVATPIGNLEDLSERAKRVLKEVDLILSEDTRKAGIILRFIGAKKRVLSLYQEKEERMVNFVLNEIEGGKKVALITEAGTPCISDPGAIIVSNLREKNLNVIPVPGPSSVLSAFSVSGFRDSDFIFIGFLPRKKGKMKEKLKKFLSLKIPVIFFESPYRIKRTLDVLYEISKNLTVFVGREMTKFHEEYLKGNIEEIKEILGKRKLKGEFTVIVKHEES